MRKLRGIIKGVSAVVTMLSLSLLCALGMPDGSNVFSPNMLCLWTSGVVSGAVCFFIENTNNIRWGN